MKKNLLPRLVILAFFAVCASLAQAAEERALSPIGQKVANFSLPDAHGKRVALDDYKDKVVVLAFVGTECPLAKRYAARLRDLSAEFAKQGVAFLGIDSNLQDSLQEIDAFARTSGVTFPVLKDNNNEIADRLGAERTPEVFLLDRERIVRYWGRIDDQYGFKTGAGYALPKLTQRDLGDAIEEVLGGKSVSRPVVKAEGCLIGRATKRQPKGDVTYSKQISRILQNRCVECHRPGEVAPFSVTSYDEVVGWAEMIREVVHDGRMPPWSANPKYGHFSNDARLSEEEKQQIDRWVENGCPKGDDKDLPEPREFVAGWRMGEPDQVIYMAEKPFEVPAEGAVDYQYFVVDPGWTTDKWIQATEPRPGNRNVVHHINVHVIPKNVTDAFPPEGIGTFGPGFAPNIWPKGSAIYVPANSKLEFQLHYTPKGTAQEDRSMIGIRFANPRTIKKIIHQSFVHTQTFNIPAGDPDYEVQVEHAFDKPTLLLSLLPHMHVRGSAFRYEAIYPDGKNEILLDIPHYDFNWQLRYIFAEPKLMPKGAKLVCTAHFDNSADNPANPDPTRVVPFGQQTWDEMLEANYTNVLDGQDVACIALVAASLAAQADPPKKVDASNAPKK